MKARWRGSQDPILEGCSCAACSSGYTRGYLHYLHRAGELTSLRLLTMHNLSFVARLMEDLRRAIGDGRLREAVAAFRCGAVPGAT